MNNIRQIRQNRILEVKTQSIGIKAIIDQIMATAINWEIRTAEEKIGEWSIRQKLPMMLHKERENMRAR